MAAWHPTIGRAIVDNWDLGSEYGEAIESQDQIEHARELPLMSRVVVAAKRACILEHSADDGDVASVLSDDALLGTVMLEGRSARDLVIEGRDRIETMRSALAQDA